MKTINTRAIIQMHDIKEQHTDNETNDGYDLKVIENKEYIRNRSNGSYHCNVCTKHFKYKGALITHLLTKHNKIQTEGEALASPCVSYIKESGEAIAETGPVTSQKDSTHQQIITVRRYDTIIEFTE